MKEKIKNLVIIFLVLLIILLLVYIKSNQKDENNYSNANTENANIVQTEKNEYVKTYNVISKVDITDELGKYKFYVIKEFQDNDNPVLIKVDSNYELEENHNYEFTLVGTKINGKSYSIKDVFDNFEIKDIVETDKEGLEQRQDF